jgi:hypothetical protein
MAATRVSSAPAAVSKQARQRRRRRSHLRILPRKPADVKSEDRAACRREQSVGISVDCGERFDASQRQTQRGTDTYCVGVGATLHMRDLFWYRTTLLLGPAGRPPADGALRRPEFGAGHRRVEQMRAAKLHAEP